MKAILATSIILCAFSVPASAQKMGMINNNAPTIEQKIDLGSTGVLKLSYVGINFGQGNWAKALADEQRRDRMRDMINKAADANPLGSFSCSKAVQIDKTRLPAGEYKLAFKLSEKYSWLLSFKNGDSELLVPLDMMKSNELSKRLVVSVYAGDEDFTGGLYLAFGEQFAMLTIKKGVSVEKAK